MTPLHNYILFKPFQSDSVTIGGIIIPDSIKKDSNRGEIIAVGEGTKKRPMKLKQGQVGFRVKNWGQEVEVEGEKYFLMEDTAIIAVEG